MASWDAGTSFETTMFVSLEELLAMMWRACRGSVPGSKNAMINGWVAWWFVYRRESSQRAGKPGRVIKLNYRKSLEQIIAMPSNV